jgi:hypothetical protein
MSTEKQIQANRLNGLKGGVKSAAGKSAVSQNAVSHGFFSKELIIKGEDPAYLAEVRRRFMSELEPEGEMETILVEIIISSAWRLKRIFKSEQTVPRGIRDYRDPSYQNVMRYVTSLERQIYRAKNELERLQNARLAEGRPTAESIVSLITSPETEGLSGPEK